MKAADAIAREVLARYGDVIGRAALRPVAAGARWGVNGRMKELFFFALRLVGVAAVRVWGRRRLCH
jgi:hypothetical protein